ncbi:MAG: metal ABC transporter permease [Bacteroidota bacterium]|nr:metal ABC transporter permease [Bacteroidota bacterium]
MDFITALLEDYTLRTVALGTALLGAVSGALGSFAVLRRQSLLGDAISHAALPGIGLAFLITGSKYPLILMIGAALTGWLATAAVMVVTSRSRIKYDSALGLVLSVFFGLGLVVLTFIQKLPDARQAGLDAFLFGQAASLIERDVVTMAFLGGVALLLLLVLWKEFKLLSFDLEFARSLFLPVRALDLMLTTLLVMAIVIGLQTVGVVLMSALIVAPAAAARQWTDRLGIMVALSMIIGAGAGVAGSLLSTESSRLPTGPTIVLCVTAVMVVSLMVSPARGILWCRLRRRHRNRQLRQEALLLDLYALAGQHRDRFHAHDESVLIIMRATRASVRKPLTALAERGWVRSSGLAKWSLTQAGVEESQRLMRERAS